MAVLALAVAAGCDSKKEAVMTSGIDLTNLTLRLFKELIFISMLVADG